MEQINEKKIRNILEIVVWGASGYIGVITLNYILPEADGFT